MVATFGKKDQIPQKNAEITVDNIVDVDDGHLQRTLTVGHVI